MQVPAFWKRQVLVNFSPWLNMVPSGTVRSPRKANRFVQSGGLEGGVGLAAGVVGLDVSSVAAGGSVGLSSGVAVGWMIAVGSAVGSGGEVGVGVSAPAKTSAVVGVASAGATTWLVVAVVHAVMRAADINNDKNTRIIDRLTGCFILPSDYLVIKLYPRCINLSIWIDILILICNDNLHKTGVCINIRKKRYFSRCSMHHL